MPLQFPTMAEKCAREFHDSRRTISIATIAKRMGAERSYKYPVTEYTFDDDSSLTVTGRGVAHRIETHYP